MSGDQYYLHKPNRDVVEEVVQLGAVEHTVVAKVVL